MLLLHMLHTEENFQLHPRSVNGGYGIEGEMGSMWCTPDKEGGGHTSDLSNEHTNDVSEGRLTAL